MSTNQSESQEVLHPAEHEPLPGTSSSLASAQANHFQIASISHLLLHIAQRLNATFEVNTLLDTLIQEAKFLLGTESGYAGLYTPQGMVSHRYFQEDHVLPLEYLWHPNHGLPGWLIVHKIPYLTSDALFDQQIVHEHCLQFGIRSALATPILDAQGNLLGFLELHNKLDGTDFTPSDQEILLALSHLAAIALSNALASQRLHEANSLLQAETAKRQKAEAKFQQLFDSNLVGLFVSDFRGTFLDANNAFLDLLGYTRTELLAGTIQRNALTPPEFHFLSQNAVKAMQETGTSGTYEKEYWHKSGKRIPALVAVARIEDTETCMGFVLDISERKELDKRKDELISMASHELKTPVTSLKGFISLLERRLSTQGNQQELYYITRVNAQVNKLTKLINDLLDLSRMQTGKLAYREEHFEMNTLVHEIIENVQGTTQTHHLLIEEQTQVETFGDRDRIGQVVTNLLNNAIKYSPQASTILTRIAKDQNNILVSIQDFGIGIAKEHQDKIFERFYQVTDPEEKTYPGLGIGLYISYEIIKRHGGQMWVESQKGHGAIFHFTLPISAKQEIAD
ncbi:MAG TPA: ATP-binding protein [Ktedonobacteraceae bacterium]|jgi:PAS domain S-box-containing protein